VVSSDISREQNLDRPATIILELRGYEARTENMARRSELDRQMSPKRKPLTIANTLDVFQGSAGILLCVERQSGLVFGKSLSVSVVGVLFLQAGRVRQKYFKEVSRPRGSIDRPQEARTHQPGQISRMVYMSMGQRDPID